MSIKIGEIKKGNIIKDWSGEGFIYKDEEAFENGCGVCYVPEGGENRIDSIEQMPLYYYENFLALAGGNKQIARHIFDAVSWEYPETYAEQLPEIDIIKCEYCGYMFDREREDECPRCLEKMHNYRTVNLDGEDE